MAYPSVNAENLDREIDQELDRLTGWGSPYEKQRMKVRDLQQQVEFEKSKLRSLAEPLRLVYDTLKSDKLAQLAQAQPYDEALREAVKSLEYQVTHYGNGVGKKPTGAKKWNELRRDGATDAQILTNLENLKPDYTRKNHYSIEQMGKGKLQFVYRGANQVRVNVILDTTKQLVANLRRIFGIKEVASSKARGASQKKNSAASQKKKAPTTKKTVGGKPVKKKATKKKQTGAPATDTLLDLATGKLPDKSKQPK